MQKIIEILKNRRAWAAVCAFISLLLRAVGADADFDANAATDAIMTTVQAISDLGMIFLPIWSLYKPKKTN